MKTFTALEISYYLAMVFISLGIAKNVGIGAALITVGGFLLVASMMYGISHTNKNL